ncbi:peptidylprolyl isomerase [Planctomycetota bacterium]
MCKYILLSSVVLLVISGCGLKEKPKFTEEEMAVIAAVEREALPVPSGGFVLAVGGDVITADDIATEGVIEHLRMNVQANSFEKFCVMARPALEQIVQSKVTDILLYSKARQKAGDQIDEALDKEAEKQVQQLIMRFGGDYGKAEEELRRNGMGWADFKESQKKKMLSQFYVQEKLPEPKPITYSDLVSYYNSVRDSEYSVPAKITFRLIDIVPDKLTSSDPNLSKQYQAKKLSTELLTRIHAGEDFSTLAKQYSHGHRRALGGLWKPIGYGALAEPFDVLEKEAEKLEVGQIAGPIEAGEHIFIMKLEEKTATSSKSFEEVQSEIENRIIVAQQIGSINKILAKVVEQANLSNKDEFINFCLEKIYRQMNYSN